MFFCAMFFVVVLKRFLFFFVAITVNIQPVFWPFKWNLHTKWSYKI